MKKQYPWITVISAIVLLFISFYISEIGIVLVELGCLAVLCIGEMIGCIKANKTGNVFWPNKYALIASILMTAPITIFAIYDFVVESQWQGFATISSFFLFGPAAGVSLAANLLNFLYKRHNTKQERINREFPQRARPQRIEIKPLVPWLIALAAVMVVQIILTKVLDGKPLDAADYFIGLAYWLLCAQTIGLIFNQFMKLRFVNYILILAYIAYALERAIYYIGFFSGNTEMNASYTQWQVSLCRVELAVLIVLIAADIAALVITAVSQFGKPRQRKRK